jgi:hypothetical protein
MLLGTLDASQVLPGFHACTQGEVPSARVTATALPLVASDATTPRHSW